MSSSQDQATLTGMKLLQIWSNFLSICLFRHCSRWSSSIFIKSVLNSLFDTSRSLPDSSDLIKSFSLQLSDSCGYGSWLRSMHSSSFLLPAASTNRFEYTGSPSNWHVLEVFPLCCSSSRLFFFSILRLSSLWCLMSHSFINFSSFSWIWVLMVFSKNPIHHHFLRGSKYTKIFPVIS